MVIDSVLGSDEISGLQAEVKVVKTEIVFIPQISVFIASISFLDTIAASQNIGM